MRVRSPRRVPRRSTGNRWRGAVSASSPSAPQSACCSSSPNSTPTPTASRSPLADSSSRSSPTRSHRFCFLSARRAASFNDQTFPSAWVPPLGQIARAQSLLRRVEEFPVEPPTPYYPANLRLHPKDHTPRIKIADLPVLTTDRFEWGTTTNRLWERG